jgi:hypothetical protein
MRKLVLWAALAAMPMAAFAGRLVLRDGTVVNGTFISGDSRDILFRDSNGVQRRFMLSQVQTLNFDNTDRFGAPAGVLGSSRDNTAYREGNRVGYSSMATLPAGTELRVRTNENINADTATEGRTYAAQIDRDAMENGNVLIPRGSEARLVVRSVSSGGTLSSGNLILDLDSIAVNGRRYIVSTADIQQGANRGIGKNKRTAEMVGGGAVLGTLVGAIAGGGKGAAIGALAGAAAGGTAQVLTKGKEIRVPAETVLEFRLDEPLQLREVR